MSKLINIKTGEKYDVYIGRGSKWGNPFTHITSFKTKAEYIVESRTVAIEKYREYILNNKELLDSLHELKGKTLGCFCSPRPCHGNILLELIKEKNTHSLF